MEIDRDGLEVLDRAECLRLLEGGAVGRVAGTSGALPVVLPVGYVLDGDFVVVDTGRGTTLDFATSGSVVAFEVDNLHERGHSGWTVMVTGVAEEIVDEDEVRRLRSLVAGDQDFAQQRFVRISSEIVSGRRTHRTHRHARSRAAARAVEHVG
ncbi:MAG TPA: pyridoxamine 5'-phosphate oxidase family protein [Acidimicrobiia bacterium]|jgi:nitroimidazol reductase NimA-like FMN-containing flavoprotein (pyridoxamine 5'-phosphate oxidase superfamily)|nr:pyridoxamine 5'-phosphate oxidase family protein [Acidimicrobiia bacterium]